MVSCRDPGSGIRDPGSENQEPTLDRAEPALRGDSGKPDELDRGEAMVDGQSSDRRLQVEAPRPGCAGVDDQPPDAVLDERLVGVAIHEDIGRVGRQELRGRRTAQFMSVADVNRHPARLEREPLRQPAIKRIDVAVNSLDGRDRTEGVEHRASANVSGMQNLRDTSQRIEQSIAHQPMRV